MHAVKNLRLKEKKLLENLYYNLDSNAGFRGKEKLINKSKLSREKVNKWLASQVTYTLHKPIKRKFKRRRYQVRGIDFQWQADLCDMQLYKNENLEMGYILTVIDIFSRYAFAKPLKTKSGIELANALKSIFLLSNRKPKYLQTDQGLEFYNQNVQRMLKEEKIELFSVYSDVKACIVERFNRTLKERMFKYFTYTGKHKWIHILPKLIDSYNHSEHRSLGRTPASINKNNETEVWIEQYGDLKKGLKPKFKLNDVVCISKIKGIFKKGYEQNWSTEKFIIHAINRKYDPVMYELRDNKGEILRGKFYDQELQLVDDSLIEKILQTRNTNGVKKLFVKIEGIKKPFWISNKEIKEYKIK